VGIYHLSVKVMSRSTGRSAIAAAAYRSASELHDERLGQTHDYTAKTGVVHSEILLPEGAPARLLDRATLWNEVERVEVRKDAQLAREVEFSIPREMPQAEGIRLAGDFAHEQFVARGMVADLNVHWDIGEDGVPGPVNSPPKADPNRHLRPDETATLLPEALSLGRGRSAADG